MFPITNTVQQGLGMGEARLLVRVLGWAAEHRMPFAEAMAALVPPVVGRMRQDPVTGQPQFQYRDSSAQFYYRLLQAAEAIARGESLGNALARRLKGRLPPDYIRAVQAAERAGMLPQVLPTLARRLEAGHSDPTLLGVPADVLAQAVPYLFVVLTCASGYLVFIVPKFQRVCREIGEGAEWSWINRVAWRVSDLILGNPLAVLVAALVLLLVGLRWQRSALREAAPEALLWVPGLGRLLREERLLRVADLMLTALTAGKDLNAAAAWAADLSGSAWVRQRLGRFATLVTQGRRWDQAWRACRFGVPYADWLVVNSAQRERPDEGFRLLGDYLAARQTYIKSLLDQFVEATATLMLAAIVACMVFSMYLPLWRLIEVMTEL